jgi:hypothetical protein
MKSFLHSIPNKFKAIYILWFFLNILLLVFGISYSSANENMFYPFDRYTKLIINFNVAVYDISEFIIYTMSPIVLYLVYYLWTKKN